MGVFFWTNSVALVEDIPLEAKYDSRDALVNDMEAGFQQVCSNFILKGKLSEIMTSRY